MKIGLGRSRDAATKPVPASNVPTMEISMMFAIFVFVICIVTCSSSYSLQLKSWQVLTKVDIVATSDSNNSGPFSTGTKSDYMYNTPLDNLPLQQQQAILYQLQQMQHLQQQEEVFKQQALNHPVMKTVTGGAVGVLFIMLTWRSLSSYELAEQFSNPFLKFMAKTPTILIMVANILGIVTNIVKPKNFKNVMKSILAVNMIREIVESIYNVMKITVNHSTLSDDLPKGIYFGRLFGNVWWMLLCISFSKSRWSSGQSGAAQANGDAYSYESSYPSYPQSFGNSRHPVLNYQQTSSNAYKGFEEE